MQPDVTVKLVILTDLHITPPDETILGISPLKRLSAAIDHINLHHADADRVVVTGDITHYGDIESYRFAKAELDRLVMPMTLLLGNHDRRENYHEVFSGSPLDALEFVQSSIDVGLWRLVFLDTLNGPPYDHHQVHAGVLCTNRLAWLDAVLAEAGGRPTLLFMHHPPHNVGFRGMDQIRLSNEGEFFQLLDKHRCVRHIVCGHIHRTISGTIHGIGFSVFKSPVHQQPMIFDTDDTSASIAEPAAYGVLFGTSQSVLVHTEDYEVSASLMHVQDQRP